MNIGNINSQTDSSFAAENTEAELSDSLSEKDSVSLKTDSVKYFYLSVKTNIENAEVYSDSVLLGRTPLDTFRIKEGLHNLKIINPISLKEWRNYVIDLEAFIDKDTVINADFSYFYFINTIPFNVKVFNNDSLLGETPLRFYSDKMLKGFLNFNNYNMEKSCIKTGREIRDGGLRFL